MSANSPLTPAQLRFVHSLISQRTQVLGIHDVDAFIAAQRIAEVSKSEATRLIDYLKALPTFVATSVPSSNLRENAYPGQCHECGVRVPAQAGWIEKLNGRWVTHHLAGQCTPAALVVEAKPEIELHVHDLFIDDRGMVWKVYLTQNGHLAVKGTVPNMKGLHYKSGGMKVLRERIAAGTATKLDAEQAAAFGKLHGFCCMCGKDIDDDRSLAAGYGPSCAKRMGWYYPNHAEAEEILQREYPDRARAAS